MAARHAIALVSDHALFPAAAYTAARLAALNPRSDTDIFIFTTSTDELRAAPSRRYPFRVVPVVLPPGVAMPIAYFRVVIPAQMVSRYARVLYLDVDIHVENAKIFALLDLDMRGHALAAVRDYVIACTPHFDELRDVFDNRHDRYFNSGVMLIDCARYAERRALEAMWNIMRGEHPPMTYPDQSLLNYFFDGDFLELSPAFNTFADAAGTPMPAACPPVVIHFAGSLKPWMPAMYGLQEKAHAYMQSFFPTSPWPDFLARFSKPKVLPPKLEFGFRGDAPIARYLRTTEFADVTAGITKLNLAALPQAASARK